MVSVSDVKSTITYDTLEKYMQNNLRHLSISNVFI